MVGVRLCDTRQPAVMIGAIVGHASNRVAATCSDADLAAHKTKNRKRPGWLRSTAKETRHDAHASRPQRLSSLLHALKAHRLRQAEREIACVLNLLGSRWLNPKTKRRPMADHPVGPPFTIHATELRQ